jgi:hypothetical protein
VNRLPLVLSTLALVIALLATTPLGNAAVSKVVPFAKVAGKANIADNAKRLNGRASSVAGRPNTIPVVGNDGKLPASLGAIGPQGERGPKGDPGLVSASTRILPGNDAYQPITSGTSLVTLSLPAGRYVLLGSVRIANKTSQPKPPAFYTVCTLIAETDSDNTQIRGYDDGIVPATMTVIHQFKAAGTARMACSGGSTNNAPTWTHARITALQVAAP